MLADMVTPGNRIVDVGCDHGFLSIYLVQAGLSPRAVAMDVREGPLAAAKAHVEEYGLGDYIEVRLSDGLAEYVPGEADAMVCAGMGGRLMERILKAGMEKARGMKELILQPQSELAEFRRFLRSSGFEIVQEEALKEDGKFYFAMKAVYGDRYPEEKENVRDLYDLYGKLLLIGRHSVLEEYLRRQEKVLKNLSASLEAAAGDASSEKARLRREEVLMELEQNRRALTFFR